ncbi:MerR family transcriptional regulator (plasmid) [Rhodococcus opacus]|uniref:MerR family transcriptional regulator n=1 Tax=Rhodococcus opacus TaxID=37919 RepID=UPI0034D2E772
MPATTLRFYETASLLPAARTTAGYQVYDDTAVDRLAFVSSARHLGLPLEEIRELLEVWEQGALRARAAADAADDHRPHHRYGPPDRRTLWGLGAPDPGPHRPVAAAARGACGPDYGCCLSTAQAAPVAVAFTRTRPEPPPTINGRSEIPVACTLGGDEQGERIQQWRQVLDSATGREDIDGGLRLRPRRPGPGRRRGAAGRGPAGLLRVLRLHDAADPRRSGVERARPRSGRAAGNRAVRSEGMTATGRPASARWKAAGLGGAAVGACAVCCAGPILSVLGGLTAASALGALWVTALAVVALVAAVALGWTRRRRSAPASCPPAPEPR